MINPFLKFPKTMGWILLICLIPVFFEAKKIQFAPQADKLLATDQRQQETFSKLRGILNNQDILVVSMRYPEGVFSSTGLTALHEVSETLMSLEGATDIKSLTHSYKPVRSGFSFQMVPLATTNSLDKANLKKLEDYSLNNPLIRNVMVSEDGRDTLINVTFGESLNRHQQTTLLPKLKTLLHPWMQRGFQFRYLALPLAEHEVRQSLRQDMQWMLPTLAVGITLMLAVFTRSLRLMLFMLVQSALCLLLGTAILSRTGAGIPLSAWLLLPFWATIQWTLLMHCISACQQCLQEGTLDPVETGIDRIFRSASFAILTTGVGIGSLAGSEVPFISEIGMMGASGVALIYLVTFGPGMVLLKFFFPAKRLLRDDGNHHVHSSPPGSNRFLSQITRHRAWILPLFALLAMAGAWGIQKLSIDIRIKSFLHPQTETRKGLEHFDKVYGGANIFQMEVDTGKPNGLHQRNVLNYLEQLQNEAVSKPGVTGVYSYAQLLAMMNQIWEMEAPGSFQLPKSDLIMGTFATVLKMQNYPFMQALTDTEFQKSYLIVRTPDMPGKEYVQLIRDIVDIAEKNLPDGCQLNVADGLYQVMESDRRMVRSLTQSSIWTAGIVLVLLILLWRSFKLGLIAVMVNLSAVVLVVGAAGWLDIPFNTFTVMIGAMAFGIAIDDAVHFIAYWHRLRSGGMSTMEALDETLTVKGRPIVFTSLVLVFTFAVFTGSSFPPLAQFGSLCAVAFLTALTATCLIIPCMLCRISD